MWQRPEELVVFKGRRKQFLLAEFVSCLLVFMGGKVGEWVMQDQKNTKTFKLEVQMGELSPLSPTWLPVASRPCTSNLEWSPRGWLSKACEQTQLEVTHCVFYGSSE